MYRLALLFAMAWTVSAAAAERPNIIFILADDLGYGDLGCYGQTIIQTPNIDRMAAEGLRFTQFYAGATVCAPSRCVLMVGQHTGHCSVRGNAGRNRLINQSLTEDDVTVAQLLKKAGYRTALIGKWGLGEIDHPGHTLRKGFDYFFGYLNQAHAHNYYPEFLWRNREKVFLKNKVKRFPGAIPGLSGAWAVEPVEYSHDLFMADALHFIRENKDRPFFLYLAVTLPHANNERYRALGNGAEVPDLGIYADKDWPEPDKGHAAMITYLDKSVGRLLSLLRELGIAERTLVLFSSDNGPHLESGQDPVRFNPSGPLRGMKRDLYEGGIRVPMIAWWPGTIEPGRTSDHVGYFGDFMATVCELVDIPLPPDRDSISFLPTLLNQPSAQKQHEYLYWEFYERGSAQAIRMGRWKAVRKPMLNGPIELYDIERDPLEKYNIARIHPDVVRTMRRLMSEAHVPNPRWVPPGRKRPASARSGK